MLRLIPFLALGLCAGAAPRPRVWLVDPLVKIFPDDAAGANATASRVWLVPRNGHASVQIAVRPDGELPGLTAEVSLPAPLRAQVRRVGFVPVSSNPRDTPADELLRKAPAEFPDPLLEDFPITLPAGRTQPLWITVFAPAQTPPRDYRGRARLSAAGRRVADVRFTIRVARATVPARQTLKVTNWFSWGNIRRVYPQDSYPKVLENLARVMAEHRQNVVITPVRSLSQPSVRDGTLHYDFSNLDRFVETFLQAGFTTIEGGHLLGRVSGYHTPLVVPAHVIEDGRPVEKNLPPEDPRAEAFFHAFLPALHAHLKERGWLDRYIQHIHDEPHGPELPHYVRYAALIRQLLPGVPTLDAVNLKEDTGVFARSLDIWVPVLGSFDDKLPLLEEHVRNGGQAWYYTCIFPQQRHLNRFIDLPLLKTRLLHWLNFRHSFTGFLHWGGNYWSDRPFENVQPIINDGRTLLPAGDNAIVYPDPQRLTVLSSLRLEAMREGIEDYELLNELARRDPQRAGALARRAIPAITDYVRDVEAFRVLQAELLR